MISRTMSDSPQNGVRIWMDSQAMALVVVCGGDKVGINLSRILYFIIFASSEYI